MYQSFYNLTGKPFRLSPDPGFFFPSRGHKRALAYLRYGLNQNEGFVVITGAPGTGKTTLAQILLNEMGEKNVVVAHLTTTQLDADDMLRMVAASFEIRYENLDKAALLKTIESFLLARSREGKRALLVIDEAQNLPPRSLEELRMLSNLQVGDKALIQTFLLGQVQFRHMLDHPDLEQLRQRVIANYHLSPLAHDETQRYIESRLRYVGWNGDPHMAEVAYELIHQFTEGVPRRINMLCDRILLFGCMEETHEITGEVVNAVIRELEQEISLESSNELSKSENDLNEPPGGGVVRGEKSRPDSSYKSSSNSELDQTLNQTMSAAFEQTSLDAPAESTAGAASNSDNNNFQSSNSQNSHSQIGNNAASKAPSAGKAFKTAVDSNGNTADVDHILENFMRAPDSEKDHFDLSDKFAFDPAKIAKQAESVAKSITESYKKKKAQEVSSKTLGHSGSRLPDSNSSSADSPTTSKASQTEKKGISDAFDMTNPKVTVKNKQNEASDKEHEQVLGNTVKQKAPVEKNDDLSIESLSNLVKKPTSMPVTPAAPLQGAPISERDLFRVIPGGKSQENEKPAIAASAGTGKANISAQNNVTEDVVLRRILRLVLAFHRSPSSFPGLDDPTQPLPEGISELLELSVADDQVLTKVSPAAVMGISPVMLRAAVRFFIRRTMFVTNGDYYRMLGLQPGASQEDIERHYDLLMRLLRQDKQPGAAECVSKIGEAYEALMRGEDKPGNRRPPAANQQDNTISSQNPSQKDRQAAVIEVLDNPNLTIDFNEEIRPPQPPASVAAYMKQVQSGNMPDPRITRRRIHLLGYAAMLGIGALVVVLGLLIMQLEPDTSPVPVLSVADNAQVDSGSVESDSTARQTALVAQSSVQAASKNAEGTVTDAVVEPADESKAEKSEGRLELSFSDGLAGGLKNKEDEFVAPSGPVDIAKEESVQTSTTSKLPAEVSQQPASVMAKTERINIVPDPGRAKQKETNISTLENEPVKVVEAVSRDAPKIPVTDVDVKAVRENQLSAKPMTNKSVAGKPVTGKTEFKEVPVKAASVGSDNKITVKELPVRQVNPVEVKPVTPKAVAPGVAPTTASNAAAEAPPVSIAQRPVQVVPVEVVPPNTSVETSPQSIVNALDSNETGLSSNTAVQPQTSGATPVETISVKPSSEQIPVIDAPSSASFTGNAASALNAKITRQQLDDLVATFKDAYKKGDINRISNLFSLTARTNEQTSRSGIKKEYQDLFSSTRDRNMDMTNLAWSNEESFARGVGEYSATVVSGDGQSSTVYKGKLTLQVERDAGELLITRFYYSSDTTITKPNAAAGGISESEIDSLLTKFTNAYEQGDVNTLMTTFTATARTNDQSSLAGIRKDHVDLFNSTNARQIFLKDLSWSFNGNTANATGNFEVMIQPKGQPTFTTVNGTVNLQVQRSSSGAQFSQFFHKIQ